MSRYWNSQASAYAFAMARPPYLMLISSPESTRSQSGFIVTGFFQFQECSRSNRAVNFAFDPRHKEIGYALLAHWRDFRAAWNLPPFCQTVTAAAGAGMLSDENGMAAHRGLSAVVRWIRRRKASSYEILAVAAYRLQAFFGDVFPIGVCKVEAAAELRFRKSRKKDFVVHANARQSIRFLRRRGPGRKRLGWCEV